MTVPTLNLTGGIVSSAAASPLNRDDILRVGGVLTLLDPAHSSAPWVLPTNGAVVENLAWDQCATIIGSGTETTLKSSFVQNGVTGVGNDALFELTTKGCFHGIMSRATNNHDNRGSYFQSSSLIRSYVYSHLADHKFLMIAHDKLTRAGGAVTKDRHGIFYNGGAGGANSNYLMHIKQDAFAPIDTNYGLEAAAMVPDLTTLGEEFRALAVNAYTATQPPAAANLWMLEAMWGNSAGWTTSTYYNNSESYVMRRYLLVDLTVALATSGATAQDIIDLERERWALELAVGGRWYGDTHTDPATFA